MKERSKKLTLLILFLMRSSYIFSSTHLALAQKNIHPCWESTTEDIFVLPLHSISILSTYVQR